MEAKEFIYNNTQSGVTYITKDEAVSLLERFDQSRDIPTLPTDGEIENKAYKIVGEELGNKLGVRKTLIVGMLMEIAQWLLSKLGKGEPEEKKACGYCGNVLRNPVSIESGYCDSYCYENKDKI
jgi:hypothetical protein